MPAFFVAVVVGVLAFPALTQACSTCTVGDPTLTVLGNGQPFEGRVRTGLTLRHHHERIHRDDGDLELREERYEFGIAWSVTKALTLSTTVPLAYQRVELPNLARARRWSLGDIDLRAQLVLFRDRDIAARHIFSGFAGLELPTGSRPPDVPRDLRAGSGTWDPLFGMKYGFFAQPWSFQASAFVAFPLSDENDGVRPGPALQLASSVQLQPIPVFGFRLGGTLGIEGRDHGAEHGTGGTVVSGVAGIVMNPRTDLVVFAQATVPVWKHQRGGHDERFVLEGGVTIDL